MAVLMEMGVSLTPPPTKLLPKLQLLLWVWGAGILRGAEGDTDWPPQPLPRATFRFTGDLLCIALPQAPHNTPLCPTPLGGAVSGRRPLSIALTVLCELVSAVPCGGGGQHAATADLFSLSFGNVPQGEVWGGPGAGGVMHFNRAHLAHINMYHVYIYF